MRGERRKALRLRTTYLYASCPQVSAGASTSLTAPVPYGPGTPSAARLEEANRLLQAALVGMQTQVWGGQGAGCGGEAQGDAGGGSWQGVVGRAGV